MRSTYFWLANVIFIFHLCLGTLILTGWLFPQYILAYWLLLSSWLGCWLLLGYCPISKLEFTLRHKYDMKINANREIIQYYIQKCTGILIPHQTIIYYGVIVYCILAALSLWQYFI